MKEYFIEILKQHDFLKPNHQLNQFKQMRCSCSNQFASNGLITNDIINNMMMNEMTQGFIKELIKCLLDTNIIDYIEVFDIDIDFSFPPILVDKVHSKKYKNVIVSSKMGSSIQDHFGYFSHTHSNSINRSASLYKIGKFLNTEVWVDPFMKYNDNRMIFFDDLFYNIGNLSSNEVISSNTFAPITEVTLDYNLLPSVSEILYVVSDRNDTNYKDYLRVQRDHKIDKIVN